MAEFLVNCSADTHLDYWNDTTNCGGESWLKTNGLFNYRMRPLLRFDCSPYLRASISAATLKLYYGAQYGAADPVGRTINCYELQNTTWVELEATWLIYKTGSSWSAAGGTYTTTDGAAAVVPAGYGWMTWDVTALMQHFMSTHGGFANFLLLTDDPGNSRGCQYYSRDEAVETTKRPQLLITGMLPTHGMMMF